MYSYLWFLIAALGEIAGCYTFWMWLRESKSPLWLLPDFLLLALFAFALTRIDSDEGALHSREIRVAVLMMVVVALPPARRCRNRQDHSWH
jgi:drug/metabolite transporter superfamily protein YnfA